MDVWKRRAKYDNHLFKTFAPLLLTWERVELQEIDGHQIAGIHALFQFALRRLPAVLDHRTKLAFH